MQLQVNRVYVELKLKITCLFVRAKLVYNRLYLEKIQGHLNPQTGFQKGHSHGIKDLNEFREFIAHHGDYPQVEMAEIYRVVSSTIGRAIKNRLF